jgi:hypothetical protein
MPTGIRQLGACGRSKWVASIFAAVEIEQPAIVESMVPLERHGTVATEVDQD